MLIKVDAATLINPDNVCSVWIETRYYFNGIASWLVVKLADGNEIRREHGVNGFDAHAALARIAREGGAENAD